MYYVRVHNKRGTLRSEQDDKNRGVSNAVGKRRTQSFSLSILRRVLSS